MSVRDFVANNGELFRNAMVVVIAVTAMTAWLYSAEERCIKQRYWRYNITIEYINGSKQTINVVSDSQPYISADRCYRFHCGLVCVPAVCRFQINEAIDVTETHKKKYYLPIHKLINSINTHTTQR